MSTPYPSSNTPIFTETLLATPTEPADSAPESQTPEEIQQHANTESRIKRLEQLLKEAEAKAASVVTHHVPEHAGGPGTEIAPTWSQAEQEASRKDA